MRLKKVMKFRYSALTVNSHRVHYDCPYVIVGESCSRLVTHGQTI
jgi:3-methylfumaryl-CoA hydratase